MKSRYLPMLAQSAPGPFSSDAWLFEIKWDGIRAIAYVNDTLSLKSRNDRELGGQFPELRELVTLAPGTVLDGEIVAMSGGKPDMQALLSRLQTGSGRIPSSRITIPVTYIVFDILEKDGKPLIDLPFSERRKMLQQAVAEGPHVILSVPVEGRGEDYYRAAIAQGLEGVMAKQKDSPYKPGLRSGTWLKVKGQKTCDCVIAGYTRGKGGRSSTFGALLLGLYDNGDRSDSHEGGTDHSSVPQSSLHTGSTGKKLLFIGKVGTGFSDQDRAALRETFSQLETSIPQLHDVEIDKTMVWLEPVLVSEVAYQEVTRDRKLRIPRFIRIRSDKKPEECTTGQLADVKIDPARTSPVKDGNPAHAGKESTEGDGSMKGVMTNGDQHSRPSDEHPLKTYQEKRNFSITSEPEGPRTMTEGNYFVIHEHHAHKLHYDLRLERDGVLKSWAVPKGIPEKAGEKHLAVAVEDHPLEYGHFEGTIPAGEYGAGTVTIWDKGTYDTKLWASDKIEITFHGGRLTGNYVLVPFKRAGKNDWLLFKVGG
jgi:DNA ligase D-like protein (predicted 3'-phosphoesterase)